MNTKLKSILAQRLAKKGKKPNGFTLVELMVVIVIVGILTAIGLPQLQKSQDKAKSIAAQAVAVNAAKDCATDLLLSYDATETTAIAAAFLIRVAADAELDAGSTCAAEGTIASSAGGDTWTVTIDDNNIPSSPVKTATTS
jgi:type IV pilus assembly protein PilA